MSHDIFEFIWNEYCDWYVELAKASLNDDDTSSARKAQIAMCYLASEAAIRFAHPIMPFITEQIWQTVAPLINRKTSDSIVIADFPQVDDSQISEQTEADMAWLQSLIAGVRNIRAR